MPLQTLNRFVLYVQFVDNVLFLALTETLASHIFLFDLSWILSRQHLEDFIRACAAFIFVSDHINPKKL